MSNASPSPERGRRTALDWAEHAGVQHSVLAELEARARRRRRRRWVAASGTALALLLGLGVWSVSRPAAPEAAEAGRVIVSTPPQERLPDGTRVQLREGAAITSDFSGPLRRVTLVRGEAHFQVAKDATRPFVVTAAGVDVRAVGTAFSVQLGSANVEVLVTEGRVAVGQPAAAAPQPTEAAGPALVDAGHLAVLATANADNRAAPRAEIRAISEPQIADRLAWRVARIEFSTTPLREAVELLNRESPVKLRLADDSLASLRISGIVRADNAAALVRLLSANYGVRAETAPDQTLELHRR